MTFIDATTGLIDESTAAHEVTPSTPSQTNRRCRPADRTTADALAPQRAPTPRDQLRPYASTRTPTSGPESAPTGGGGLALSRCPMLQLEASTSIQNVIDTSRSPTVISADVLKHFDPTFRPRRFCRYHPQQLLARTNALPQNL